jgi:cytochrome bd-type quinol oxidase subunit 1
VILLGDESGYEVGDVQRVKLAAIEAEWETEPAPAAFTLFGFPSNEDQETHNAIKVPWADGPDRHPLPGQGGTGLKDLMASTRSASAPAWSPTSICSGCATATTPQAIRAQASRSTRPISATACC